MKKLPEIKTRTPMPKTKPPKASHRLGDGPIEPDFVHVMEALAHLLDDTLNGDVRPRKNGFVLLTFKTGAVKAGRINYISNCKREDVVSAMREQIAYFQGMFYQGDNLKNQ